ncbi:MAG: hypothetical protein CMF60_08290 [Magnetococcales bacterium]|nr:hypothetical protein [Magnetococcales bacterium]
MANKINRAQFADKTFWVGPVEPHVLKIYPDIQSMVPSDADYFKMEYNPKCKQSTVYLKSGGRLEIVWPHARIDLFTCVYVAEDGTETNKVHGAQSIAEIWEKYYPSDRLLQSMVENTLLHESPNFNATWFDEWMAQNVQDRVTAWYIYAVFAHDLAMLRCS